MDTPEPIGRRTVLFVTTLPSFLIPFMGSSINIALPSIGKDFRLNVITLGWVATAYLLAAAMFLVPFGRVADIHGRKKVFLCGLFFFSLSCLLAAFSTSALQLIAFRAMQGIGAAMIFSTAVAILTSVFPPSERGEVLGINVAAVYLGLSCGPILGGFLTQYLGWRSVFWVNVPLGLIVIGLVFSKLKGEWAEAKGEKFDYMGSAIYSLTLLTIIYGLSLLPATSGFGFLGAGFMGLIVLFKYETKRENPVFHISLFRKNKVFAFSNLAALINYSATFAVSFLLSLYLQYIKGFKPPEAGMILVSQPLTQALFSPIAGRLSDRIEPRIVASTGMALTTVGLFFLLFLTEGTPVALIMINLILLGFGFALFSSPNTNAVMGSIDKKYYGVASGTLGTMRTTGMMLSMGVVMLVFAMMMGKVQITPEHHFSFLKSVRIAYTIFFFLCGAGIFASLSRGKVR